MSKEPRLRLVAMAMPPPIATRELKARQLARLILRHDGDAYHAYMTAFRRGVALGHRMATHGKPTLHFEPRRPMRLPAGAGPLSRWLARFGL